MGASGRVGERLQMTLLEALRRRRSRRFAPGMTLPSGPLAYASRRKPEPLTVEEEAALAFAACGVTGHALAELPYGGPAEEAGGHIMTHFVARTVASGDAMHDCTVFVTNNEGTWLLKRPQDYARGEIAELLAGAASGDLGGLYEKARVKIAEGRTTVAPVVPFVAPFNKWMANVPGSTYFLPVAELTALTINVLLSMFDDDFNMFVIDDHNGYQPAGVAQFSTMAGGRLVADPAAGRTVTLSFLETWVCEFVAIEQGGILQNLGLMAAALEVGGFPHFAAHPFAWPLALGFRSEAVPLAKVLGVPAGALPAVEVPTPIGLEREGRVLIKPFCPPYYRNMEEAVQAFLDYKYAEGTGTFRDAASQPWREAAVGAAIPRYSQQAVDATVACCTYIYERYGRFPASSGPFRTVLAYQAHRLDPDFYERFYKAGV
jgi:hypothetical protein